jgi:hypothetical protein
MTTRSGSAYAWPTITDLVDGVILNRQVLYKEALHRLQDFGLYARDLVFALRADLASQADGTPAVVRGTVVMGTLSFYDPIDTPLGSLDGKTLIITSDLAGPVTITFAQPTSPSAAVAQANAQGVSLGITFAVDDGAFIPTGEYVPSIVGKFRMVRPGGGTASITVGAGTANGVLGLTEAGTLGSGTANDGASKVHVAPIAALFAGGTLRSALEILFDQLDETTINVSGLIPVDGGTLSSSDQSITSGMLTGMRMYFVAPAPLADRTYTLPAAQDGYAIVIRANPNPPFNIFVKRLDTTTIATLSGTLDTITVQQYVEIIALSGEWVVTGFGNSDANMALT